jgi:hypothetical protein
MVRSSNNTSNAKITAAMGALKIPAMAPAAPHPIKMVFCFIVQLKKGAQK